MSQFALHRGEIEGTDRYIFIFPSVYPKASRCIRRLRRPGNSLIGCAASEPDYLLDMTSSHFRPRRPAEEGISIHSLSSCRVTPTALECYQMVRRECVEVPSNTVLGA